MLRRLTLAAALLVASAGCTSATNEPTSSSRAPAPSAFAAFDTASVVVATSDGERRLDVWLAATDAQRQRGLMEVTDPALEGRTGMAFWFSRPTEGGFWMRNTRLPLTIVFVGDDGLIVAIAEMVPCPDSEPDCPITRPGAPFRWALEVPTSRWDDVGIDLDSTLRLEAAGLNATGSS